MRIASRTFSSAAAPCAGEQVADGRFHGTDDALPRLPAVGAPQLAEALELDRVADGRAGGVALDQVGEVRLPAGLGVGGTHRPQLAFLGRREQVAVHVVRHTDTAQDAVNLVVVPQRIREPFEGEDARALTDNETIRRGVERGAAAARRQCPQLREAHLCVEAVGAGRTAGEHQVARPDNNSSQASLTA